MDPALIRTENHGDIKFDFTMQMDHSVNIVTTSHPVQVGAEVSDHAYREPDEVTLQVAYSDTVLGSVDGHSMQAFATLETIANERQLVTLITRLKSYPDMLITSISVPDNFQTMYSLRATIIFKKIDIVDVETVQVQATVSSSKSPVVETEPAAPAGPTTDSSSANSNNSSSGNKNTFKPTATVVSVSTREPPENMIKQSLDDAKNKSIASALKTSTVSVPTPTKAADVQTPSKATVKPSPSVGSKAVSVIDKFTT